jgi:uncharacterized membrane protein
MDVFVADWLNLILRWAHLVVGIGWIGTSFYFIALDLGLRKNPASPAGVYGEQWQVHGGGFYHVDKYTVAPPQLPKHLVWFRWEAYLTWMTGFGLAGRDVLLERARLSHRPDRARYFADDGNRYFNCDARRRLVHL